MEATQHIEVSSEELSLIAQGIDHYRNAAEGHRNKPLVEELRAIRRRITKIRQAGMSGAAPLTIKELVEGYSKHAREMFKYHEQIMEITGANYGHQTDAMYELLDRLMHVPISDDEGRDAMNQVISIKEAGDRIRERVAGQKLSAQRLNQELNK